jgi:hemerythrin-like metal-binding protein
MNCATVRIYGSGHEKLDRDHEVLIRILEDLAFPHLEADRFAMLRAQLLAYVDSHFENEESLMAEYGYPAAEAHIDAHAQFRHQVEVLMALGAVPDKTSTWLVTAIKTWVAGHMRTLDAAFADFLHQAGAPTSTADGGLFPQTPAATDSL